MNHYFTITNYACKISRDCSIYTLIYITTIVKQLSVFIDHKPFHIQTIVLIIESELNIMSVTRMVKHKLLQCPSPHI